MKFTDLAGNALSYVRAITTFDKKQTSHCDHCHTKRYRAIVFVFENECGEKIQVGSTCVKKYMSHSSALVLEKITKMLKKTKDYNFNSFYAAVKKWHEKNGKYNKDTKQEMLEFINDNLEVEVEAHDFDEQLLADYAATQDALSYDYKYENCSYRRTSFADKMKATLVVDLSTFDDDDEKQVEYVLDTSLTQKNLLMKAIALLMFFEDTKEELVDEKVIKNLKVNFGKKSVQLKRFKDSIALRELKSGLENGVEYYDIKDSLEEKSIKIPTIFSNDEIVVISSIRDDVKDFREYRDKVELKTDEYYEAVERNNNKKLLDLIDRLEQYKIHKKF